MTTAAGVLVVGAVVGTGEGLVVVVELLVVVEPPQAAMSITSRRLLTGKIKRFKNMACSPSK
jgi:hypothetical protein